MQTEESLCERGNARRMLRGFCRERCAQGTVEYAIAMLAMLSTIVALALFWHAGEEGGLVAAVERAASHALNGIGALDILLF